MNTDENKKLRMAKAVLELYDSSSQWKTINGMLEALIDEGDISKPLTHNFNKLIEACEVLEFHRIATISQLKQEIDES